ncbi:Intrafragellar transport 52, osm-6-like protein, partial [Tribonema minus]
QKSITFDVSKRENYHPGGGFKKLARRLKTSYKVLANKDDITDERLAQTSLIIFGSPRAKFSNEEFASIKAYLNGGGSVAVLLAEGGEGHLGTNVNYLLEEFGVAVHADSVVRTAFYKYLHPKEVFVSHGVLNPELARMKNRCAVGTKGRTRSAGQSRDLDADDVANGGGLAFVYPYGASLTVQAPAQPILSSGPISYPLNRPLAAVWERPQQQRSGGPGRLLVVASTEMFSDEWIDKEENGKLWDVLVRWLLGEGGVKLDQQREYDISEYTRVPNSEALADRLRCCLQETEELPRDFTKLFNENLFKFDMDVIPEAVALYEQLDVKHEPLTLIPPTFECPLPPLNPAVFPPAPREPPPPPLDLFDLDEHFASDAIRLAQLTNKCAGSDDLEYYIKEGGEILGVIGELPEGSPAEPKHILHHIFRRLVRFKMLNQEGGGGGGAEGGLAPTTPRPSAENAAPSDGSFSAQSAAAAAARAQQQQQQRHANNVGGQKALLQALSVASTAAAAAGEGEGGGGGLGGAARLPLGSAAA